MGSNSSHELFVWTAPTWREVWLIRYASWLCTYKILCMWTYLFSFLFYILYPVWNYRYTDNLFSTHIHLPIHLQTRKVVLYWLYSRQELVRWPSGQNAVLLAFLVSMISLSLCGIFICRYQHNSTMRLQPTTKWAKCGCSADAEVRKCGFCECGS